MGYESESDFMGLDGSSLTIITGKDDTCRAPSPFLKRADADTLTELLTSPDVTPSAT